MALSYCIGKKNYNLQDLTTWYKFRNIPTSKDTRCEYCYKVLKQQGLADDMVPYEIRTTSTHQQIDCDSIADARIAAMRFRNFEFQVLSGDKATPYLVHGAKSNMRDVGLYVVEMPKTADYCIKITNLNNINLNSWALPNAKTYYTFELKVGNKKAIINSDELIYYSGEVYVEGFETNKRSNFMFVANVESNGGIPVNNNDSNSNLIIIKIN